MHFKKKLTLSMVMGILLMMGALACQAAQTSEHMDIPPADFQAKIKKGDGLLLDVRTPKEVAQGTIEGAMVIDFFSENFKESLAKLDKNKPVYVFCRSGNRSGKTMAQLKEMGFPKVYNLAGGMIAWKKAGYPTTAAQSEQ